jgi:urea transport system ATP-binding protein
MSNTDFAGRGRPDRLLRRLQGHRRLNLYVDRNELRVIIGPNGAGKTTLLDLICGKTRATGGSIKFKNEELTAWPSTIACAWASAASSRRLDLREPRCVEVLPRGRSVRRAAFQRTEVAERVRDVAAEIGLGDRARHRGRPARTARSSGWRSACC